MKLFRRKPPPALFDDAACSRRLALAARRPGLEAAPIRLYATTHGVTVGRGLVDYEGHLPTSPADALAAINRNLGPGSSPLKPDDVYIHYMEAANSGLIGDRFMFLDASTLVNIAIAGGTGIAFMNSHRTGGLSAPSELPFGRTFAGRYEESADGSARTTLGIYMLRGVRPNGASGPSTDDLHRSIAAGTLSDVSMGLTGGTPLCDVCRLALASERCGHAPGTHRQMTPVQIAAQEARGVKGGKASYTLAGAMPQEVSAVFKGAVPGAGFRKATALARAGQLAPREVAEARESYVRLAFGQDLEPGPGGGLTLRKMLASWEAAGRPEDLDLDMDLSQLVTAPQTRTTERPPMPKPTIAELKPETDLNHARRVNAAALGSNLSPRAREALSTTGEGRAALALSETGQGAARPEGGPWSNRPAPAPAPATTAPEPGTFANPIVVSIPAPPTADEDAAFLARSAGVLGPMLASQIRKTIAELESQASSAPLGYFSTNWPATVRTCGERIALLKAMLAAAESRDGKAGFRAPTPAEIAETQGRMVAEIALAGKWSLADLVTALDGRLNLLRPNAEDAARAVDAILLSFVRDPSAGVEGLRESFHKTERRSAELRDAVAAMERTASRIRPALASAVARAVDAAGGRESVEADLATLLVIDATPSTRDPAEEELAAVTGQLKAIGEDSSGRAAAGLRARRDELTSALEGRRTAAREAAASKAARELTSALAGSSRSVQSLTESVAARPDSFAPGLAQGLADAPKRALEESSYGGFAFIIL